MEMLPQWASSSVSATIPISRFLHIISLVFFSRREHASFAPLNGDMLPFWLILCIVWFLILRWQVVVSSVCLLFGKFYSLVPFHVFVQRNACFSFVLTFKNEVRVYGLSCISKSILQVKNI